MPALFHLSDAEVHAEVLEELKYDALVDQTEVGVEVDEGVVTLTGTVESYAKKAAALEAAHRVRGVLDVVNDIQVRSPAEGGRTDTEIAQAVRRALEWDALVRDENISTTVENGWVTLEGTTPRFSDLITAADAVRRLEGVRGITNNVTVYSTIAAPSAVDIRQTIEQALERRAEREARHIRVDIDGGEVTLYGTVQTLREEKAVVNAVAHAPGVTRIESKLTVDPQE